jgi:nicotinamide-nucleotide amidase
VSRDITAGELDFVTIDKHLVSQAIDVLDALKKRGLKAVTAESCTGGLIATVLSEGRGAAEHFEGAFVVYTPEQKSFALKVPLALIEEHGIVSGRVAVAMAEGALERSRADIAISVTGVAGPEPDEQGNPVGLVYFGFARRGEPSFHRKKEFGDRGRSAVRYAAAQEALAIVQGCAAGDRSAETPRQSLTLTWNRSCLDLSGQTLERD